MKPNILLITSLMCFSTAFAADPPSETQGHIAMEARIRTQSQGLLRLSYFEKTNGQKAVVNGVEVYTMDCSVQVKANEDCAMTGIGPAGWNGSFAAVKSQQNPSELDKFNPMGGAYAGYKQVKTGAIVNFNAQLTFDSTERGWRCDGMMPPALPDEKKVKELLVGDWKDDQGVTTFGADGSLSRGGQKIGKWEYKCDGVRCGFTLFDDINRGMSVATLLSIDTTHIVTFPNGGGPEKTMQRVSHQ